MKHFNKFLFVFLLFAIISSVFAQKTEDNSATQGFILKSVKPKFSITFPASYKQEEHTVENGLKTELYRAVKGDNVYMFKFTEHKNPAVSSDNKMYMEASLESFVNGIQADLIKKYDFKEKKQKGLEAFLKIPDKNLYVFYRVLIIKHVQYQIIVITKDMQKSIEINKFFASFSI